MTTKLIEDREQSLDELVKRARSDRALQDLINNPGPAKEVALHFVSSYDFDAPINSVAWSPDDTHLAVATENKLYVRQIERNVEKLNKAVNARCACFNPHVNKQSQYLFYASGNRLNRLELNNDFRSLPNAGIHILTHEIHSMACNVDSLAVCSKHGVHQYSFAFVDKSFVPLRNPIAVAYKDKAWGVAYDKYEVNFYHDDFTEPISPDPHRKEIIDMAMAYDTIVYLHKDDLVITGNNKHKVLPWALKSAAFSHSNKQLAVARSNQVLIYEVENVK
jgi:hypothetical protein